MTEEELPDETMLEFMRLFDMLLPLLKPGDAYTDPNDNIGTPAAFMRGQAALGSPIRVFDWNLAARTLRERNPATAEAGLALDWEPTMGTIWRDHAPLLANNFKPYLSSNWAIPQLRFDDTILDCWVWQKSKPKWDEHTYWPPSALKLLKRRSHNE